MIDVFTDRGRAAAWGLAEALDGMSNKAIRAGRALQGADTSASDFNQGLHNVQQGLAQVGHWFDKIARGIQEVTNKAVDAFTQWEVGMARVAIVMGKTGAAANDLDKVKAYDAVSAKISQIGRDTEFMQAAGSEAFVMLTQAGLKYEDALAVIDKTMAFSSASAGTVDLAGSVETATLAMSSLGLSAEQMNTTFDHMFMLTNKTKLQMRELEHVFRSMGPVSAKLVATAPEQFLVMAGALRDMGRTGAQVGNDIQALSRGMNSVVNVLGKGGAKGKGKLKVQALAELGISRKDLLNAEGQFKDAWSLVRLFKEKVTAAIKKSNEPAVEWAKLQRALGGQQVQNLVLYVDQYEKTKMSLEDLQGEMLNSQNATIAAQETYLATLEGINMVMEGSIDRMLTKFMDFDVLTKAMAKWITRISNAVADWIDQNPKLASQLVLVLTLLKWVALAISAVLVAMAGLVTLLMIVNPLLTMTGGSFTFAAMGAVFFESVLLPLYGLLAPLISLILTFAGLAGIVYLSYTKNLGGFRDWIDTWVADIKDVFDVIGPMLSGEGIPLERWNELSKRAQNVVRFIVVLRNRLIDLYEGFKSSFIPILKFYGAVLSVVISVVTFFIEKVGEALGVLTLGFFSLEESKSAFERYGWAIGVVTGLWVAYKAAVITATFFTTLAKIATWGLVAAKWALSAPFVMVLAGLKKMAWAFWNYKTGTNAATASQWKFNAAALANPYVLVVVGIIAIVTALALMTQHWDEVVEKWESFGLVAKIVIVFLGMLVSPLVLLGFAIQYVIREWDSFKESLWDLVSFIGTWGSILIRIGSAPFYFLATLIGTIVAVIVDVVMLAWDAIIGDSGEAWDKFVDSFGERIQGLTEPFLKLGTHLYDAGANLITSLVEGIIAAWEDLKGGVLAVAEYISDLWPSSPAKAGPLREKPPARSGRILMDQYKKGIEENAPKLLSSIEGTVFTAAEHFMHPTTGIDPKSFVSGLLGFNAANNDIETVLPTVVNDALAPATNIVPFSLPSVRPVRAPKEPEEAQVPGLPSAAPGTPAGTVLNLSMQVSFGDIKLNVDSLDSAEADRFTKWVAGKLSGVVEDELRKAGIA